MSSSEVVALVRRVERALDEFDTRISELERAPTFTMQEGIKQRRAVVKRMREAGLSIERIAAATGAGRTTIHRDLDATQPEVPERVVGVDGRRYPARHTWGTGRQGEPST